MTIPENLTIKRPSYKETHNRAGVYCLVNNKHKKRYIGKSTNLELRMTSHNSSLNHKHHHCKELQRDFDNWGYDNFEFVVLETISEYNGTNEHVQLLSDMETKWILKHPNYELYNKRVPSCKNELKYIKRILDQQSEINNLKFLLKEVEEYLLLTKGII